MAWELFEFFFQSSFSHFVVWRSILFSFFLFFCFGWAECLTSYDDVLTIAFGMK